MASQFIGLHMSVVLRDPAGYRLTGTVREVEAGNSLTLTNGMLKIYYFSCYIWDVEHLEAQPLLTKALAQSIFQQLKRQLRK